MRRYYAGLIFWGALVAVTSASCAEDAEPVNRVGVNVVDKGVFEDSWYMSSVVIDTEYEGSALGTYPGDAATDFNGSGFTTLPRIRWVIDEDYLYAYRDYEIVAGLDGEEREPGEVLGHPVAAFAIESHFDIRRAYNTVTGEEQNVIVENTTDRRWYERQFMRVDWSENLLPRYYGQVHELYAVLGIYKREPSSLFVQEQSEFPDSWKPQFHRMSCEGPDDTSDGCHPHDRDWAADYDEGEIYSFNFVNQEILSPGQIANPFTGRMVNFCASPYSDRPEFCTAYAVFVRHSFLRVSDERQYEALNYDEGLMDQHGYFRLSQPTYDRSTAADDPTHGRTDFLNYAINRHNTWMNWFDEETGEPIPYADRNVRQTVWYSSAEMPGHLMKPSFESVSEWNEVLMSMVRDLRGEEAPVYARQDCQTENPDGYCYCMTDPDTGDVLNPTCEGRYDPFEPPSEAADRLASGEPFDCYVDVPEGAEPSGDAWATATDESFYGWFDAQFTGSECAMIMRSNTCNLKAVAENGGTTDGLDCEERGDIRFKLVSYVDIADTPFLGVAQLRSDPVSGEIITGDANIGGGALDSYRTSALRIYDVLNGYVDDEEVLQGEDIREYLASLNQVQMPAPPRIDFLQALKVDDAVAGDALPSTLKNLNTRMDATMTRLERLKGPEGRANTFSDLRQNLVGTDLERRLTSNMETLWMSGLGHIPNGITPEDINEEILERASPLRMNAHEMLEQFQQTQLDLARRNFLMPNEYTDWGAMHYVQSRADWPRARVEFNLNRVLYGNAQAHELGHCMGLRHDFAGNTDTENYYDDYYVINERLPLPAPAEFDTDGTAGFSAEEERAYQQAYEATRKRRELAGIDETMNSSIMEYTATFYARTRPEIGHYDQAAIRFGYGNLEVANHNVDGLAKSDINPANTPRTTFTYYHGGELCDVDADCPFATDGENSSLLLQRNLDAGITQRCVPNLHGDGHGNVCSNIVDDLSALAEGTESPEYTPAEFRYCTDDRTSRGATPGTLGWCNIFDEGDSYREVVRNFMEQYDRMYIFSNFRRYRRNFSIGSYVQGSLFRQIGPLMNIYQNMIYEYHRNTEYRTDTDSYGFYDQFLASADILNFYARILAQPDVGTYRWDDSWQRYERANADPDAVGAQLRVPVGAGRYFSSIYQSGLSGIQRVERVGTFYDKLLTLQFMSLRGFQPRYTPDVPFFTNFYDVFPVEMQQIFGGMIQDEPEAYMPRVVCDEASFPDCEDPTIQYVDFYRGDCSPDADADDCRPDPVDITYRDMPFINGGGSILLQLYAAIYGLTEFPVYFDTAFQQQLFICVEGAGDCFLPSEETDEGVDFIRYKSRRYSKNFLAWQVEPGRSVSNQTSIGFAMLKEAQETAVILRALQTYRGDFGGDPLSLSNLTDEEREELAAIGYELSDDVTTINAEENRLDGRLRSLESFFNQIIQLQREIGISDFLNF